MKISYIKIFIVILPLTLIAQNKKYELKGIQFLGNNAISSSSLSSVLLSKESPGWFSQFINKFTNLGGKANYFDSLLIPNDIAAIKSLYQSKGFFKASVKAKYIIDASANEAMLFYNINESQPAYFNSFVASGLDNIDPEFQQQLGEYAKVDSITVYEDALVVEKGNYILNFLRDHGFMLAKTEAPTVIVDTIKNKVDVKSKFDTGKRYKINNIYTTKTGRGIDFVGDNLLKEIVGIKTDQWYSNYDIQRGQVRLYRTDLFTSAVINSVISDTVGNLVPLNISADVGMMHELSPELIMNNEDNTFNLGLALNFVKKNFLGDARKFTLGTSFAAQNASEFIKRPSFSSSDFFGYADARAGIEQPFLFGKPITTKIETYLTVQKIKDDYNSSLLGAKLSFDFELPQFTYFTSLSGYFNIERSEYSYQRKYLEKLASIFFQQTEGVSKPIADSLAVIKVETELKGKLNLQSANGVLGINLGANKTNSAFFPSEGYTFSFLFEDGNSIPFLFNKIFRQEFTRPLFFKAVATTTFYPKVYSQQSDATAFKFKIGQIFTYKNDKADIPLNQRLYAGGSNSVRGWATRQLVPQNPAFSLLNPTQEDLEAVLTKRAATGGFFLIEGSIETRNRFLGALGAALFIDYGNTWNGYKEFRFDEVAVAAGFGFRYYSEYIPFRIDFGLKAYDPKDRRSIFKKSFWKETLQFHIGIGEAF